MKEMSRMYVGEKGRVLSIELEPGLERRLRELGLCEGAELCCVGESPPGDPRAYRISGAVIALRQCDTAHIIIKGRV